MKTFLAIIFLLTTGLCYADAPAGKTATVTVTYTGSDGKSHDFTSANLLPETEVTLPLYISDTRHWTALIAREYDNDKPANRFEMHISDIQALYPPHGDNIASPITIMTGTFEFESGKPVMVLKTSDYSITVTVTLPEEKK